MRSKAVTKKDFLNLDVLLGAFEARACNLIMTTVAAYATSKDSSKVKDNERF